MLLLYNFVVTDLAKWKIAIQTHLPALCNEKNNPPPLIIEKSSPPRYYNSVCRAKGVPCTDCVMRRVTERNLSSINILERLGDRGCRRRIVLFSLVRRSRGIRLGRFTLTIIICYCAHVKRIWSAGGTFREIHRGRLLCRVRFRKRNIIYMKLTVVS